MKRKVGIILVLALLLVLVPVIAAEVYELLPEHRTKAEIAEKVAEGWILTDIGVHGSSMNPPLTVNRPFIIRVYAGYQIDKYSNGDHYIMGGGCDNEIVGITIYKNGDIVYNRLLFSNSTGEAVFQVTLSEPSRYTLTAYTPEQRDNGKVYKTGFSVNPEPTTTPTVSPLLSPTPTSIPTTSIPGFQIIPAIVALLALAYLLRRRK